MQSRTDFLDSKAFGAIFLGVTTLGTTYEMGVTEWGLVIAPFSIMAAYWVAFHHAWWRYEPPMPRGSDDLPPEFLTTAKVRDWLPIRWQQCADRGSRKSRWLRSYRRRTRSKLVRWRSGTR
jgi:hypothetical protein